MTGNYLKLILCLLLYSGGALGQSRMDSMFNLVNSRLQKAERTDSGVQLFMHVDKSVYIPNENIWFSAYLMNSAFPRQRHHTLYVSLTDPESKKVVASNKFVFDEGLGAGTIFLPDSLPPGNYQLIAFTNTYLQEPLQTPFVQSIKLFAPTAGFPGNTPSTVPGAQANAAAEKTLRVKWFPESGNLVVRLKTKVAFEVRSLSGKPYGFTGDLLEDGVSIATVRANESGMGMFEFTPADDKTYAIKPRSKAIDSVEQIMPPVVKLGYNISVAQAVVKDTLRFTVSGRPRINAVYVMVHDFKRIYYFEEVVANIPRFIVDVTADKLPSGLCTITIFDTTANPVAERTVLTGAGSIIGATISADSSSYHTRSKVKITVRTVGANGKGVPSVISLAAVFKQRIDTSLYRDITPYHYYHRYAGNDIPYAMNAANHAELELFLLTRRWTRYRWEPPQAVNSDSSGNELAIGTETLPRQHPQLINPQKTDTAVVRSAKNTNPYTGSTLHWVPLIKTDNNGHAEITFYTNDLKGEFICIVQGVTEKGVVSGKTTFRVE